jgi:L-alanine-DL-glutamate epimerase-like enolase superfamily enzyme
MVVDSLDAGHYRIPLPTALSDSTHGTITHFELIAVRLRDSDGAEGLGYTYTVGTGGAAVHALIARDLAPVARRPTAASPSGTACGGASTTAAGAVS